MELSWLWPHRYAQLLSSLPNPHFTQHEMTRTTLHGTLTLGPESWSVLHIGNQEVVTITITILLMRKLSYFNNLISVSWFLNANIGAGTPNPKRTQSKLFPPQYPHLCTSVISHSYFSHFPRRPSSELIHQRISDEVLLYPSGDPYMHLYAPVYIRTCKAFPSPASLHLLSFVLGSL